MIEEHKIEKQFDFYYPGLVERYLLTPFPRTELTTFLPVPVSFPEKFPVVSEEQPIREVSLKQFDKEVPIPNVSFEVTLPRVVHYQRETRHFEYSPSFMLRPQPLAVPEIPDEIGKSSMLSLELGQYDSLITSLKTKQPFGPFTFTGFEKFELPLLNGPNPIDLHELVDDDGIDNLDISPQPRPFTDFVTKPLATKNKSVVLAEVISDGQLQWRNRQREGAVIVADKISEITKILNDQTLSPRIDDLQEFLKT